MNRFELKFDEERINNLENEVKNNEDFIALKESLNITEKEFEENLNILLEYVRNLNKCKGCLGLSNCKQSSSGLRCMIKRDMDGNLTNNLTICPKSQERFSKLLNLSYTTYKEDDVLDEKNVAVLKNNLSLFVKNNKDGIKHILKNEPIKGLYIKISDSKLRKSISLALANSILKVSKVSLIYFPEFVRNLKGDYGKFNQELFDIVKDNKVLIMVDVGSEAVNAFSRDDVLINLLDYRLQNDLTTLIVNSFELEDLKKIYNINKYNDSLKANLVVDKIKEILGEL